MTASIPSAPPSPTPVHAGASATITLPGDLTSSTVGDARVVLTAACERLEAPGSALRVLCIDLRRAQMVDSVGLNLLVGTIKRVRAIGGRTELLVRATNVERILMFTRLHQIAQVVRDA